MNVFLNERKQRVFVNRQASTWKNLNVQIPQGLSLGPLLCWFWFR